MTAPAKQKPRVLKRKKDREQARRMRDQQWRFAERVAAAGTLWVCWWNKNRHHDKDVPSDLMVCGLIDGCELLEWLGTHPDWWDIGEWSDERYAAPVRLTDAGRAALASRHLYDMEPVTWGMVEPGYQAVPLPAPGKDGSRSTPC
jgi:hypothetical protein